MSFTTTKQSIVIQEEQQQFIQDTIAKHEVVVFAKSWCPYCHRTKALLKSNLQNHDDDDTVVQVYDLDMMEAGDKLQEELYRMTGQATVPSVWINGNFVGGNSETQSAMRNANGKLSTLLLRHPRRVVPGGASRQEEAVPVGVVVQQ